METVFVLAVVDQAIPLSVFNLKSTKPQVRPYTEHLSIHRTHDGAVKARDEYVSHYPDTMCDIYEEELRD
jgi:hypothetical protein